MTLSAAKDINLSDYTNCRQPIGLYNSKYVDEPLSMIVTDLYHGESVNVIPADSTHDLSSHYDFIIIAGEKIYTVDSKTVNFRYYDNTPYIAIGEHALYSQTTTHICFIYGGNIYFYSLEKLRNLTFMESVDRPGANGSVQRVTKYKVENIFNDMQECSDDSWYIPIPEHISEIYRQHYTIYKEHIDREISIRKSDMPESDKKREMMCNLVSMHNYTLSNTINSINSILYHNQCELT